MKGKNSKEYTCTEKTIQSACDENNNNIQQIDFCLYQITLK